MLDDLPSHVAQQRIEALAAIRAAFRGARRSGGVSWSESRVIDNYGNETERAEARARDTDTSWEDLVGNPNWKPSLGTGGFSFLDPIGFAYYLPAAMTRAILDGWGESTAFALTVNPPGHGLRDYRLEQWRAMDEGHGRAIAKFLRYMIALTEHRGDEVDADTWRDALNSHWAQFE